ncbi:MAG: hypothetical protein GKR89_32285, partial [Candidatus Latescibacteria bacterium]|nr:hypothetical protein [Candidatus Latescibacterota bacterium]
MRLRWGAVDEPDLAGYAVFRSQQSNGQYLLVPGQGDSTFTTGVNSFVDSLQLFAAGQAVFYRVAAVDTNGLHSERSAFVGGSLLEDQVGPGAAVLSVAGLGQESGVGQISVRWVAPIRDIDGSELTGLVGYILHRSEAGSGSFVAIDSLDAGMREYVDQDLKPATTYTYRIIAYDGAGNSGQSSVSEQVQTGGLATPVGLQASGEIGRVELSWQAVPNEQLLGYDIYRSTRSDQGYERLEGSEDTPFTTGQTAYTDSSLTAASLFFYKVMAVGQENIFSSFSVFVSARVLADEMAPAVPQNLSAVADESDFGRVTVRWSGSIRDSDGGELTGLAGYVVFRSEET